MKKKKKMPIVALRGLTVLPDMIIHFDLSRRKSIMALEQALMHDQKIFLITQKTLDEMEPCQEDLYQMGTVALIKQITKLPGKVMRVLVEGIQTALLLELESSQDAYLCGFIRETEPLLKDLLQHEEKAMLNSIKDLFDMYIENFPKVGKALQQHMEEIDDIETLMNQIFMSLPIHYQIKQQYMEIRNIRERFLFLAEFLNNELEVVKVKNELTEKVKERVEKNQKEYILREQLNYIRKELGEQNALTDADFFDETLRKCKINKEIKDKIQKEINRFRNLSESSLESSVERTYIETLLELPWDKMSKDTMDLKRAKEILDRDHYGLEQVKTRVIEFLAVRILNQKGDSPIICLVGPPGTGKTSIAKSVAEALNKKYIRISLGGVRDEAEIRGHRKTYVGAMPGRIVTGLRQAGVKNPLILLDEIDKVSSDYKGDTQAALLEVLDSEQHDKFRDHYIELPLDLSEVLFIATANTTDAIPRALLDRMEVIEVNSYTSNEKFHIAKNYLVGKQREKHGLLENQLIFRDQALHDMIEYYVREAGVRQLERKIGEICRKTAREILEEKKKEVVIKSSNLEHYLGKKKYHNQKANQKAEIGIVRGLAWTSVGGETLSVEVNSMPGKGDIELTGQMGDIMKESAMAAMSYIRSISNLYGIEKDYFLEHDFHIHIPEGAVPKDGPSAGITMATALLSQITEKPVDPFVAMTGEITLRGKVLPVGGLKEKILAAKAVGMKKVLLPEQNKEDLEEIPKEIKENLTLVFVDTMDEVIRETFLKK